MSKENKQLENKKAFYDDFVFKFPETKLNEVIQKKREESGFYELCEAFVKAIPASSEDDKKENLCSMQGQFLDKHCGGCGRRLPYHRSKSGWNCSCGWS